MSLPLLSAMEPRSLTEAVADVFRARPGQWIDMHTLARVGGTGGWRTRVSDCRRQFNMTIENRTRRALSVTGRMVTVSEYRWVRTLPDNQLISTETVEGMY